MIIDITQDEFKKMVEFGSVIGFYNRKPFALYSKLIALFATDKLKLDHIVFVQGVTNINISISESTLLIIDTKNYKIGGIRHQDFNYNHNSIFDFCKKTKRDLYFIKLNKLLTEEQKSIIVQDIKNAEQKNYRYSLFLAALSEVIPKRWLKKLFPNFILHSEGTFCSLFVAKILKNCGVVTQEEFSSNPLPSPSQLLEYSCFEKSNDGSTILYKVILD